MSDVTVNIKLAETVGDVGSWFPCLYVIDNDIEADKYAEYSRLSDVAEDFEEESEVYAAISLMLAQNDAPYKVAVLVQSAFSAATMEPYAKKGWRQLVLVGEHSNLSAIASYVESTKQLMMFATVQTTTELTTLYSSVGQNNRTFIVYHATNAYAAAAVVGATAGLAAGSFTYKNMKIKGVTAEDVSVAELENIHKNGAITIIEKAGDIVTSEGTVASGEYADNIDSEDFVVQSIAYKTQKVFNNNKKVPYTNQGIAMLETATLEALKAAYNNGMIAENEDGTPAYGTSFALRSETTENDRATRHYPYGTFYFTMSGAIHTWEVNGTVTV